VRYDLALYVRFDLVDECASSMEKGRYRMQGNRQRGLEKSPAQSAERRRNLPRSKFEYCKITSFKCCMCRHWRDWCKLRNVKASKWILADYRRVQCYFAQKGLPLPTSARVCAGCVISCPGCDDDYPLDHACRYGLCLECNVNSGLE
jgi:hypothetical protein